MSEFDPTVLENFTDHARVAMAYANREAMRLKHSYIGTEHILLGLLKEHSGAACAVLKRLGVVTTELQVEVERRAKLEHESGTTTELVAGQRSKRSLQAAISESQALQHSQIGTEHLLIGVLQVEDGIPARVLRDLDLGVEEVRREVLRYHEER